MSDSLPELEPAGAPESLSVEALYQHCDPATLGFATTADLQPLEQHLGQERAVEALELGLKIPHAGYNIFLLGSTGVGKHNLLNTLLASDLATPRGQISDWCYVNNFDSPDKPVALQLPQGMGRELKKSMAQAVEDLLGVMPETFQSEEYQARAQEVGEHHQEREKQAFQDLAERALAEDIALIQTPAGYTLAPAKEGEILTPQDFEALPEAERKKTLDRIEALKQDLKQIVRQLPNWKKEARNAFKDLNREFSKLAIDPIMAELKKTYEALPAVLDYLEAVHTHILEEAEAFTQAPQESAIPDNLKQRVMEFPQYNVNILVDNAKVDGAPVVYEDSPGFGDLVGRVEHIAQMGTLVTDFNLVKPGALHRANGGYLILDADKLLTSPYAWTALKRALKSHEIRIQSLEQMFSFVSTVQLEPQPIPLNLRVILVGDRFIYYLLQQYDPEFASLFKVAADMSEDVARSEDSVRLFARMLATLQQREELLPFEAGGIARLVEFAARQMGDSERLTLNQRHLADLMTEADFLARQSQADEVTADHVSAARQDALHRLDQFREKSHEGILREITHIDTEGSRIGQVNGLAVYMLGNYAFGKPSRITATARLGPGKVLDIEREVDLGGQIHSKAVMIISALMASRYARNRPLPITASLVFEQSYGGIEGDSASVAELVALLSAIADIPVRQDLAVTGSLDQQGRVQAIGGVNEKIEGFFDICTARGLSGRQGVVIPASNRVHLMLRDDVRQAVIDGRFHVYTVASVDEALEVLTGSSVASIERRVDARLTTLEDIARKAHRGADESGKDE